MSAEDNRWYVEIRNWLQERLLYTTVCLPHGHVSTAQLTDNSPVSASAKNLGMKYRRLSGQEDVPTERLPFLKSGREGHELHALFFV